MRRREFLGSVVGGSGLLAAPELLRAQTGPTVTFSANNNLGRVHQNMFGVNCLGPTDDVKGRFAQRIANYRISNIRWPGGLAEDEDKFNPLDPNAEMLNTLRDFLSFCGSRGAMPTIVLPTKRYRSLTPDIQRKTIESEIGSFVRLVTATEFSATRVGIFEIGNEFYVNNAMSADEYGMLAEIMARVVRVNARYPVQISIQGGLLNSKAGDQATNIRARVTDANFDLLTIHSYPLQDDIFTARNLKQVAAVFPGKPFYLSEWNVRSCADPSQTLKNACATQADFNEASYGIRQAGAMVAHLSAMSLGGLVRHASFWAVQQNNNTSMWPLESTEQAAPYVAGRAFQMLGETGPSITIASNLAVPGTDARVDAFRSERFVDIYVRARTTPKQDIYVKVSDFSYSTYFGSRLYGSTEIRKTASEAPARAVRLGPSNPTIRIPLRDFTDHELVRVRLRA